MRTAPVTLSVRKSAVDSKGLLKTRSSLGLSEWVASVQKARLRGRPLHKKYSFKPAGEPSWDWEAPGLHFYLGSLSLAPSILCGGQ